MAYRVESLRSMRERQRAEAEAEAERVRNEETLAYLLSLDVMSLRPGADGRDGTPGAAGRDGTTTIVTVTRQLDHSVIEYEMRGGVRYIAGIGSYYRDGSYEHYTVRRDPATGRPASIERA
jgi:xanthine/CO dehydrogenase XdhC/CoxF family maturation factor